MDVGEDVGPRSAGPPAAHRSQFFQDLPVPSRLVSGSGSCWTLGHSKGVVDPFPQKPPGHSEGK